jgi:feruloyl esterase
VYSNPTWDPSTFTVQDAAVAEKLNPSNIRTWPNDLSAFRNASGKIVAYQGGQDNQITSFDTERFYRHLSIGMQALPAELDEFFRFFRISGMFHCNSGPGAWVIGQGGGASAVGVSFERANNVLAALVDWVENGIAPETIEGTKFVNDNVTMGPAFQRRHCRSDTFQGEVYMHSNMGVRYPFRNSYIGGDHTLPSSWECVQP